MRMRPAHLSGGRAPLPRAFGAPTGVAGLPYQSEAVSTQGRSPRRATSASAHRQGSWEYILDVGRYRAQRCQDCGQRFWIERRPKERCPACGGELRETEERRRETKAGFACRKDCQAALTRKLTTLAEHTYVLPSRLSLREFLLKVWLPAIESGVRATTLSGYRMLVEQHLVPQLGAVQLQSLNAAQINAHYARLLSEGRSARLRRPLPQHRAPRPCRAASCPARRREVGLPADQRGRLRRPAARFGPAQRACRLVRGAAPRLPRQRGTSSASTPCGASWR